MGNGFLAVPTTAAFLLTVTSLAAARPTTEAAASRSFHELSLTGAQNAAGFAVTGIRRGTTPYELEVSGSSVTAHPRSGIGDRLTGPALVGLVIDLRDPAGKRYALRFAASGTTTFWAGSSTIVPTYELTYTNTTDGAPRPLCTVGVNQAILFEGDRYDAARKTVIATGAASRGWINIACAGTALAKLFLIRHTEASQEVRTTRAERQAMLKMFTADVCGDGTSFTVHGQPLFWADAKGITRFPNAPRSLEAVWNEKGAVCLEEPRRPELANEIQARCGPLPRCTPTTHGHVVSAIPR
jgi:ADYC domain